MKLQTVFWMVFFCSVFVYERSRTMGAPNPQSEDMLQTLLELDRMYSSVARPRFGKRINRENSSPDWSNSDYNRQILKDQLLNYLTR